MLFRLHIQLSKIHDPEVWRRLIVPSQFSFYKFHQVIQKAFGWKNYHLFHFIEFERSFAMPLDIGTPDPDFDESHVTPAKQIKLNHVFPGLAKMKYIYDFGDLWEHVITLEGTENREMKHASLLGGEGACPPEDCGGIPGYHRLKALMTDPADEEYEDMREWLGLKPGKEWDPFEFNLEKSAAAVSRI